MHRGKQPVCLAAPAETRRVEADSFAREHGIAACEAGNDDLQMRFSDDHIELYDPALHTGIHVDFIGGTLAHRKQFGGGKGQAIAKAVGLNKLESPRVLDVTAGLARDAYVLACLGCRVTLIERSPVLYELVNDGVRRARASSEDHAADNFVDVILGDSIGYLDRLAADDRPDVIYMDPMYPERKKTAQVKKDMQILHKLIGTNEDAAGLLDIALDRAIHRVVVKRPSHAEHIGGRAPTMGINSKKTRYDVYVVAAL